jgi:hypothetical protein
MERQLIAINRSKSLGMSMQAELTYISHGRFPEAVLSITLSWILGKDMVETLNTQNKVIPLPLAESKFHTILCHLDIDATLVFSLRPEVRETSTMRCLLSVLSVHSATIFFGCLWSSGDKLRSIEAAEHV